MSTASPFTDEILDEIVNAELAAQVLLDISGTHDLRVTHANQAARSMLYLRQADVGRISLLQRVPEPLVDLVRSTCAAVGAEGVPVNLDDVEWPDRRGENPSWVNLPFAACMVTCR